MENYVTGGTKMKMFPCTFHAHEDHFGQRKSWSEEIVMIEDGERIFQKQLG